ncbi:transcription factor HES-5-like [Paramormyrops kingsleyae]|uniref:Transcription factor HES-5 n=1 Tax=Paramormyrops kingsleyae TaxID=1676925 RepID=A0A3B3SZP5_9TELE|nr:transcription factor HES-5-like [Paramormyrops kingsleyae]
MAPIKTCNAGMTTKEKTKLRKPVVEKMRRDRINGSIQQLKALLEKELKESQLTSKLEKADILEMAVLYLRDNLRPAAPRHSYAEGFAKCLQETLRFLSAHDRLPDSRRKLLDHFHPQERRADKHPAGPHAPFAPGHSCSAGGPDRLWRPW